MYGVISYTLQGWKAETFDRYN